MSSARRDGRDGRYHTIGHSWLRDGCGWRDLDVQNFTKMSEST
jgi:hypothetical protein